MSTALIEYGVGFVRTDVIKLEKGEVDTLLLVGGKCAQVIVEVQTDDGANHPSGLAQFDDYIVMDGENPLSIVVQMYGPIDYCVRREVRGVPCGCNVRGQSEEVIA